MLIKKFKNTIAILFIIFIFGCKNNSNSLIETNHIYQEHLSLFDTNFINHFPLKIKSHPMTIWSDTNAVSDHVRIMLEIEFDKSDYDSLIYDFESNKVAVYRANDTCLLIVNRFTQKENWHLRSKHKYVDRNLINKDCYKYNYPIPNFWDSQYLTFDTETRLPADFLIYVLEAKKGKFWDSNHITNGQYMPEFWKNGYSKGVTISKKRKKLIYWFIIW